MSKTDGTLVEFCGELDVKIDLPPEGSVYLGWDAIRESVVIGYTECGGYNSFLGPNVSDDCHIVAWAPLSETSDPDPALIPLKVETPYGRGNLPILIRDEPVEVLHCDNCGALLSGDYAECLTDRESGEEFCNPNCRDEWEDEHPEDIPVLVRDEPDED